MSKKVNGSCLRFIAPLLAASLLLAAGPAPQGESARPNTVALPPISAPAVPPGIAPGAVPGEMAPPPSPREVPRPAAAPADVMPIVQTGPLMYADVEGHLYVVVVRGANDSGIFLAYSPSGVPIQQFSPDQLPPDSTVLYLSYDPAKNSYRQLVLSESRKLTIQGSFRLRLGKDVWLGVDTFNNPYASIVLERPGKKPTILAFVGLERVVLAQDEKAAALLAATQSLEEYRSFIDEYHLTAQGLFLKEEPVKVSQVGIQVMSQNVCLGRDVVLLTKEELAAVQKLPPEAQKPFVEKRRDRERENLDALIMVKITDNEVTGYLPDERRFYFIEQKKERPGDMAICVFSTAQL